MAYLDGQPAGWVAVEPRTAFPKLRASRIPWRGRGEDKDDDGVWAVTCLVVRKGFRGRGLTYPLARATIDFARERGVPALEAYPMITQPGKEIAWGEMHVGARQVFEEAGFLNNGSNFTHCSSVKSCRVCMNSVYSVPPWVRGDPPTRGQVARAQARGSR